jgi:ribosomal protein S25
MTKLHTIPVLLEYNEKDCKKGEKFLIQDIANTVAAKLVPKIRKPVKATLIITYYGLLDDKHRNRGFKRKQAKS